MISPCCRVSTSWVGELGRGRRSSREMPARRWRALDRALAEPEPEDVGVVAAVLIEDEVDSEMGGPTEEFVERLRRWLERKRIFDLGGGSGIGWEKKDERRNVEASNCCSICYRG
eukprot:SAG11_NODE_9046_length_949_cov_1.934118_2_plen_115_part_00